MWVHADSQGTKQGFSAPDASWFRGESIEYVRSIIFNDSAHIYDYLDQNALRELVQENLGGLINRRLLIWWLLSCEWWLRQYVS